ncbi:radical SAM protein [Candidatus Poribacteria bacterium]
MRTRIRIDDDGQMEVVDPGFEHLELLRSVEPGFQISTSELPGFTSPRFLKTRDTGCGIGRDELTSIPGAELWDIHASKVSLLHTDCECSIRSGGEASMLDLKTELCKRMLTNCRLCAHGCGVDRICGEMGICGLGTEAVIGSHFIHIAEEPFINPSLLVSLAGCGLRCRYCQQWELLEPKKVTGKPLDETLWREFDTEGARSLSFIGGNPDESLYSILRFLASAPPDWDLPIVWNCHGYGTPETTQLLDGVVDVYVPDLKYGSEKCGWELSGVSGYPETAKTAIQAMVSQDVPVIVRILVLPGHFHCCHSPALEFLSSLDSEMLFVSMRDQYCPDWIITQEDGEMARRPSVDEVGALYEKACYLALRLL